MKHVSLLLAVLCLFVSGITAFVGESNAAAQSVTQAAVQQTADKVDINTADAALLSTLPGIGEKTAAAIISYREENGTFKSLDELEQVKGIGAKKLAQIRPYLQEI